MGKNKVTLEGFYGGDITHSQAAWTSTNTEAKTRMERIPALLSMLAREEHGTPFERSLLHFSATVDTATHIHFLKHRHFSINGESARYKEYTEDKYYIPADWHDEDSTLLDEVCSDSYDRYHQFLIDSRDSLTRKRAKESA